MPAHVHKHPASKAPAAKAATASPAPTADKAPHDLPPLLDP
jgi:hypothetical protein